MDTREIVEQLLHGGLRHTGEWTKGCGSCRRFMHRLKRRPGFSVGWDDIPQELLERFSSRLHRQLFWY